MFAFSEPLEVSLPGKSTPLEKSRRKRLKSRHLARRSLTGSTKMAE